MSKRIPSARLTFAAVVLTILAIGAPARAQDADRMDAVIRDAVAREEFSGSVLVARGDQVLLDRGYGFANREWEIPNAGDTKFRLASVSKQFTAVAILLLQERGSVDLDAPVKTWLPDAPASWDGVTVRHLLTHTSGIPDLTRFEDFEASKTRPATLPDLIARFRDQPLAFQPGERWSYSNSGYILLTAIVEKASGQAYADFVAEALFRPLGMTDTGYDSHAAILPRRASGYAPTAEGYVNADYVDMSIPQGAGSLYSTTRDLLKWEQGLFGGRVLNTASMTQFTTPFRNDYALGVEVTARDGHTVVHHNGGIEGFNTWLARDRDAGLTVVVLGNLNGPGPDKLGADLMTLAQGGTVVLPDERRAVVLSQDALRAYEGVYQLAPNFALTVSLSDGRLSAQATGQRALEMFAEGDDGFFLRDVDARMTFSRNAAGAITGLMLHQGGREMPAPRQ